jgi:LytR cell envelope-related transcriptional attenuator
MTTEDPNAPGASPPSSPPPSSPARRSSRQGVGGSPVGSTLSIVLAVVAVVAGFLILRNITDDGGSGGSATPEATTPLTVAETIATTTTTTEPPLVTQGAVVVVANGSGVPGSAGRMTEELKVVGFTMSEPTNATTTGVEQSLVYFDPANAAAQSVADSVARVMGGLVVEAVPSPPPIEGGSLGDAGVLVILGTAQADKTIAELSAPAASVVTAPPVAGSTPTGTDGADVTATTGG